MGEVILKVRGKVTITPGSPLLVDRLAEMAGPPQLVDKVKGLTVARADNPDKVIVLSALDIARVVMAAMPGVRVDLRGEDEVVVLVEEKARTVGVWSSVKTALVAIILFLGSAMAIINFHSEVSMAEAQARLYWMITGQSVERPLIMQIPYSLGIGIGIALFFNHFRYLLGRDEPSPLEVEMFLYDRNVQQCIASVSEEKASGGEEP